MIEYTAYHRSHYPFAAEIVATAPSLAALQQQIEANRIQWTDIYNSDASFHLQSPRGAAQTNIAIRKRRQRNKAKEQNPK